MNKQTGNNISAFIVAGGQGSRLGELGKHTQKCMLELWGKPMLYYPIVLLKNAGCSKIVIAVNHLSEQIKNYFKDGKEFGVNIEYVENNFISTYDALYQSLNHLSDRILYIHANILFENTLLKDIISLGNQSDKNVIAVIPNSNIYLKHAQVSVDNKNDILAIDLTERNNKYPYTFLGVAYYKKRDFIAQFNGSLSGMVEKLIQQLLDVDVKTLAYQYQGKWRHIETEDDYLTIKQENKFGVTKIIPSLVINLTDKCNMQCIYCPPYGENLCKGRNEYDIKAVKMLIKLAKQNHFKTVRLTGGEPLLKPECLQVLLEEGGNGFERVVLNTNGALLKKHFDWLKKYKDNFVLKISLDSIDPDENEKLSQRNEFNVVFENINTAINLGFHVEINTVLVNQKLENIKQLILYFTKKNIPIKLLTLSNYYGNVETNICNFDLDTLLDYLEGISEDKTTEPMKGYRGITMLKYTINNTKLLVCDHSCKSSKTPMKRYLDSCEETCSLFPCDTGSINIAYSTDGILSVCRGRKDLGYNIFNKSESFITEKFNLLLKQFDKCIEINVNNVFINKLKIGDFIMFSKEIANQIDAVAREEIAKYGLPTERHYNLSLQKGIELANKLNADENLVKAGVALMDIKLGYAVKELNKQPEHVKYSVEFAEILLKELGITEPYYSILINCIAAHHGKDLITNVPIPFESLEAEIVANADCYRFIHPRGVTSFFTTVSLRKKPNGELLTHKEVLDAVELKLDEKHSIMSLPEVKAELEPYYKAFKDILTQGRD